MKYYVLLGLVAVAAAHPQRARRGVIHDEAPQFEEKLDHGLIGESSHHHHIQHEHAKSHQSIKFEHFHPVPVYVKKEHSHLLKHPLEKGKFEHNLKQIHPETEHSHGGGLVLEDHRFDTEHSVGFSDHSDNLGEIVHLPEHGFGGDEGLKAWAGEEHHGFSQQLGQDEGHGHYEYQQLEGQGHELGQGSEGEYGH